MAFRSDIIVHWEVSPRIIEITTGGVSPSLIIIQDIVDTCRVLESELGALDDDYLIDASGKENLGQGVRVGITVVLLNAKLKFADRSPPTWIVCNVSGGNLVALDSNGDDMDPIEPSAYVTIVKTSSSSATLQEESAIQYSSYGGGVTIDYVNGTDGTVYPIGTAQTPCKTLANATTIASSKGFNKLFFKSDYTFPNGTYITNYDLIGEGMLHTTFTFETGCILAYCHILEAICTGYETGISGFMNCKVSELGSVGLIPSSTTILVQSCLIAGTITLPSNYSGIMTVLDSWSVPTILGVNPIIDVGGSTASIQVRNFNGWTTFKNVTEENDIRLYISSGGITLHSSVEAGNFIMSGVGVLDDQSTSVTSFNVAGLISKEAVADTLNEDIGPAIQHSAYEGGVNIDTLHGVTGIAYPAGTSQYPVNNLVQAKIIAQDKGFGMLSVNGDLEIGETGVIDGYFVVGKGPSFTDLVFLDGCTTDDLTVTACEVEGVFNGEISCMSAILKEVYNLQGIFKDCSLEGPLTFSIADDHSEFVNCTSFETSKLILDFNNGAMKVQMLGFTGYIVIRNFNNALASITLDFMSGECELEDTVVNGAITIRGVCKVTDHSDWHGSLPIDVSRVVTVQDTTAIAEAVVDAGVLTEDAFLALK